MSTLQTIILQLRATGMTQQKLVEELGNTVTQATLSRWESGQVPRTSEQVLRLAALLRERTGDASARPQ